MGLDARIAFARKASIHAGWVKVMGLLAEAGLAESEAETIGFRIVIDIEPIEPANVQSETGRYGGGSALGFGM